MYHFRGLVRKDWAPFCLWGKGEDRMKVMLKPKDKTPGWGYGELVSEDAHHYRVISEATGLLITYPKCVWEITERDGELCTDSSSSLNH